MCWGVAAHNSDDNVKLEDGERIVEEDGDDREGEGGAVEGIPFSNDDRITEVGETKW